MTRQQRRFLKRQEMKNQKKVSSGHNENLKNKFKSQEQLLRGVYNSCPTMIHEDDYVPMDCVLCGKTMETIHDTHNPSPLKPHCYAKDTHETGNPNRCCSECQSDVMTARFNKLGLDGDKIIDFVDSGKAEVKTMSLDELSKISSWEDVA